MPFTLPADIGQRPVVVDGAGTLGRRIASACAAGGTDVHLHDVSSDQLEAALRFVADAVDKVQSVLDIYPTGGAGDIAVYEDRGEAVREAWMVIEAVPEDLELKRDVISELDRLSDSDALVASSSSSLPTSQMVRDVEHRWRVLNTHYQQPPQLSAVALMSCGKTDEGVIQVLMSKLPEYGLVPFWVRRESDGFIFNRIWASIKRECLTGGRGRVATPEDSMRCGPSCERRHPAVQAHGSCRTRRRPSDRGALRGSATRPAGRSAQPASGFHRARLGRREERARLL